MKIPHPIPYQGSKRNLAPQILQYFPSRIDTLVEPFAGSAAISLAAAANKMAQHYHLNDRNEPLVNLLKKIITSPSEIAREYELLWRAQHSDRRTFYDKVRDDFNKDKHPVHLLYLLARCVKGSVRYNANGEFNQSPDNRRSGMLPSTMRLQIMGVSQLLKGKVHCTSKDYKDALRHVTPDDLIYFDPPYRGVCNNRDSRYYAGIDHDEFVKVLDHLNTKNISFIVSYDGKTGDKTYGELLPAHLKLLRVELMAGRSTQHTLLGNAATTIESLYISSALSRRLHAERRHNKNSRQLLFAVSTHGIFSSSIVDAVIRLF